MFNYSSEKNYEPSYYKINMTAVRLQLKRYARELRLTDAEAEVNKCLVQLKDWQNSGYIRCDEDLDVAVKGFFKQLKSARGSESFEAGETGKKQTICWKCQNAVPRVEGGVYVKGCRWSIKHKPVEGWTAEERTLEDLVTYNVRSCPKFIKG